MRDFFRTLLFQTIINTMRYAISDIHGCVRTFQALLKTIHFSKSDELFLLGDYIDRGPDSKGVIDYIWALQESGHQVMALQGNHEELMLDSTEDRRNAGHWLFNCGGSSTVNSFNVLDFLEIDEKYWTWIDNLPNYHLLDDYILVHAGLNFQTPEPLADKTAMRWIRKWYRHVDLAWLDGRIVLHGHTPVKKGVIEAQADFLKNGDGSRPYLDIDCGCVYNDRDMHQLCAFNLDDKTLTFQPFCG